MLSLLNTTFSTAIRKKSDPTPFIEIVSEIGDFLLSEQGEYIIIE